MAQMADLDVVAQEHGIDTSDPGALVSALREIRRLDEIIDAATRALDDLPFAEEAGTLDVRTPSTLAGTTAVRMRSWIGQYGIVVRRIVAQRDSAERDILGYQRVTGVNRGA